ncbi:TPA: hypothetical protein RQK57_002137 [Vibrio vulnificus]|nr:hypothetical protein [Vibrio vulnificus]
MSLWDSLGENLTNFAGTVTDAAGNYVSGKLDPKVTNTQKAESAAPEENRKPAEQQPVQPNGAPVPPSNPAASMNEKYIMYGVGGLLLIGLIVALKNK